MNTLNHPTGPAVRVRTRAEFDAHRSRHAEAAVFNERPTIDTRRPVELNVEQRDIATLTPNPRNARTHSRKQIQQIAASIRQFGFCNPLLIDRANQIVAGHGRYEAAKLLGVARVPTILIEHLSPAELRAYVIADNRLAQKAGWDDEVLAIELQFLTGIEIDFPVEITGFDTAEIDLIIEGVTAAKQDRANDLPDLPDDYQPVTRPGDLWLLGEHKLLCGDARDPSAYAALLGDERAQMVFTDPPYNVPIAGHVSGLGRIQHREFAMASGEMSEAAFTSFLETVCRNMADASQDGAIHFVFMDWRHLAEVLAAGRKVYSELKNLCVWNKDNGGMGAFYRSKHELVLVWKVGTAPHINNFGLGESGRYRVNVWDYPGVNTLKRGRLEELAMHPTVKPVALVADAIKDCSRRNGIILDAFGGSGTTLIAAQKTGRAARIIELDPVYVDVAIKRWEKLTGAAARHAETGRTFADLATARSLPSAE